MQKLSTLLLISSFLIKITHLQDLSTGTEEQIQLTEENCKSKDKNCSQCIQTPHCKWCKDPSLDLGKRCFYKKYDLSCKDQIENPESKELPKQATDEPHQSSSISPSNIHVKLRPGSINKLNVSMFYKDEENRPLDLYILMDLSCTMSIHKDRVAKLAEDLANNLKKLTKELRMGFGSFIDKPILPFTLEREPVNGSNCNGKKVTEKTHLFKNHLSLTPNIENFTKTVEESKILTNIDVPEGGLDALIQAIACKKELNWSYEKNTRRLIVLSTDGSFHIAGDGKLGGILLPNDGKCHLDTLMEYDQAKFLDYPSVSQVRDKIRQNNVYVIFAVTNQYKHLYEKLSKSIGSGLTSVSVIAEDSSQSITKVIVEEYKKVVRTVSLQTPMRSESSLVKVTYYAKCPGSSVYKKQDFCDNLTPNATVNYKIELELKTCPINDSEWSTDVEIQPSTFSAGTANFLKISVDMLCGCDCESTTSPPNVKCHTQGFEQCGICHCNSGFGGPHCNCSTISGESVESEGCLKNGLLCSERGECECGKCKCKEGYIGDHCECKDCQLKKGNTGVCNEKLGQGRCECTGELDESSVCNCSSLFRGVTCECPLSEDECKMGGPDSSEIPCNNFGHCECGKCDCKKSGHHGKYCELESAFDAYSNNCKTNLTKAVESCVKCLSFDYPNDPFSTRLSNCEVQCGSENEPKIKPIIQTELDQRRVTDCEGTVMDEKRCKVSYFITGQEIDKRIVHVKAESTPICPPETPFFSILFSVVGAILVIGILTLFLWKILTGIHDKKEYEKFENERNNVKWGQSENPLYVGTVSEFQNPAYSGEAD